MTSIYKTFTKLQFSYLLEANHHALKLLLHGIAQSYFKPEGFDLVSVNGPLDGLVLFAADLKQPQIKQILLFADER